MGIKLKFKGLKSKYAGVGIVVFIAALTILQCLVYSIGIFKELHNSTVNYASVGILVCNIVCLLFICIQIFRIDSRNLLTRKTAGIVTSCGIIIILCMLIRGRLFDHTIEAVTKQTYTVYQDCLLIYVIGFLMIFLGSIIRKAVNIKEENDLTV